MKDYILKPNNVPFVLYGDSYLPINFSDVQKSFISSKKKGLMTVLRNQNQWDTSNVEFEDGRLIEYNKVAIKPKMNFIHIGF